MTRLFPTILIVLDVAAAVVYMAGGDARRFIYWTVALAERVEIVDDSSGRWEVVRVIK